MLGRGSIPTGFAEAERTRFRSLLALAAGSSFDGEREAALAAARRLASRHGMSLAEAARTGGEPEPVREESPFERMRRARAAARAHGVQENEGRAEEDRARFRAAWEDALRRGLDREEGGPRRQSGPSFTWRSRRRLEPVQHATVLLNETRLPFAEIAEITGLDCYAVVGLKLKLRDAA